MKNGVLAQILDWAEMAQIDLTNTEIVLAHRSYSYEKHADVIKPRITFYHDREMADNIRSLKRVVKMEPKGKPPYVNLFALIMLGETEVELMYEGAFECIVSHTCKAKGWEDHQLVADGAEPDVMMEE